MRCEVILLALTGCKFYSQRVQGEKSYHQLTTGFPEELQGRRNRRAVEDQPELRTRGSQEGLVRFRESKFFTQLFPSVYVSRMRGLGWYISS